MKYRTLIAAISLASLTGCTITPTELRSELPSHTFTVDSNYQSVYRTIKTNSVECWSEPAFFGNQFSVNGELYTDVQKGYISLNPPTYSDADTLVIFDITSIAPNETRVITFVNETWKGSFTHIPFLAEQWFNGDIACHTEQDNPVQGER